MLWPMPQFVRVHVPRHDEHDGNRQVVVGNVGHPQPAGRRVQPSLKGKKVCIGPTS